MRAGDDVSSTFQTVSFIGVEEDVTRWEAAAHAEGLTLDSWIKLTCRRATEPGMRQPRTIPANVPDNGDICGRCGATWGEHIGARCPDDEGTFELTRLDLTADEIRALVEHLRRWIYGKHGSELDAAFDKLRKAIE